MDTIMEVLLQMVKAKSLGKNWSSINRNVEEGQKRRFEQFFDIGT